jgi:hypothetical protein
MKALTASSIDHTEVNNSEFQNTHMAFNAAFAFSTSFPWFRWSNPAVYQAVNRIDHGPLSLDQTTLYVSSHLGS